MNVILSDLDGALYTTEFHGLETGTKSFSFINCHRIFVYIVKICFCLRHLMIGLRKS